MLGLKLNHVSKRGHSSRLMALLALLALLALSAENSPVTDEFPSQRPLAESFDVFFDRRLE